MKVLMFGWEYPPHVYGGLATANFGITEGLHAQGDVDITLCLPHPFGDEDQSYCRIVAMNRRSCGATWTMASWSRGSAD